MRVTGDIVRTGPARPRALELGRAHCQTGELTGSSPAART
jgi:hypothetical protein